MASFFSETYRKCSCGNQRFEIKKTALLTDKNEQVDVKIVYVCTKCGKIFLSEKE